MTDPDENTSEEYPTEGHRALDRIDSDIAEHSKLLGESEGIGLMSLTGPVGKHDILANGATMNNLAEVAFQVALSEAFEDLAFFHVETPEEAATTIEEYFSEHRLDPALGEQVATRTMEQCREWDPYHSQYRTESQTNE